MNLVFHHAALGDFALILPMLRSLEGKTTVIAPWSRGMLAKSLIDGVNAMDIEMFEFTRMHQPGGPQRLSPAVRDLLASAKRVISFVSDGRDAWAKNIERWTPSADAVYLATRPPRGWRGHVTAWHRAELESAGVELFATQIKPSSDPAGPLVIHPGSGGEAKCWPVDRYEQVIENLIDAGRTVQPVFGEAELERWPSDRIERWQHDYKAKPCLTLEALLAELIQASGYLGNDAGPTHVAAQLGLPVTALFGPTDPKVWRPIGPSVSVIAPEKTAAMGWLEVSRALDAVTS
jgi:hypothetical protein